jgi:acetyl esterase
MAMRKVAPLHPEAKRVQEIIADLERGVTPPVSIPTMRALMKKRSARLAAEPPPVGHIENRELAGVPVRIYTPAGASIQRPAYIYAHGGGFVVGDLDMVDAVCATICQDAGIVVVSVDYRLAPEHTFPAGLDDTIAVTHWIGTHGSTIGIDTARLAIGGDSAGGNLAAATAQALAGRGISLRFQVLVYPVTDLTCSQPSYKDLGTGYPLTAERMKNYVRLYLADPKQATDPRASPLLAASFEGLPPALVIVAGLDPLVDEGLAYAQKLRDAGLSVETAEAPDHPHGFMGWTRECRVSRDILALIGQRLKQRLNA